MPQSAESQQPQGETTFSSADNEQLLADVQAGAGAVVTPINETAQRYLEGDAPPVTGEAQGYIPDAEQLLAAEGQRLKEQNGSAAFEQLIQEAEADEAPMSEDELAEARFSTVYRNRSSKKAA